MVSYNINTLHSNILSKFYKGETKIEEKSNKKFGNYFEISVINENKEVRMIIPITEMENTNFNWYYLSNPLNESSDLVERNSNIHDVADDIKDIFNKNRFSEDYLKEI